ncbi:ead/Ea22-like family protein [Escherichia coli]|nr:ead/Ea22-like family protein [Escherichia coli]
MSKIDYQKLREIAEKTKIAGEAPVMPFDQRINALNDFMKHFSPDIALVLLDERERNQQYIKRRDQENEEIALTVGKLRVELEAEEKTSAARLEALDRTHKMFQREQCRAEAAEKRIAWLEKSEEQLINERDHAESALADMYFAATGDRPEWSNWFGFSDAVDAVVDRIADLEAKQPSPVVPEGLVKAVRFYEQVKRENPPVETGAWKDAVDWVLKEACKAVNIGIKGDAGEQNDEKP